MDSKTLVSKPLAERPRLLLAILLIAEVCSAFEVSMIYAALPTLNRTFGDPASVSWVITTCFLMSAIAAALCGRLGDLLGRRKLLLVALLFCGFGSTVSALSSTLQGVIVGTTLQGVSGAILALCFGLARQWLPADKVPFAVGMIVAAAALGSGLGLVLGGVIVDRFSWNIMFFVSGSYAFLSALLVWLFVPKSAASGQGLGGISLWRGILFAPAIGGVLLAINMGTRLGGSWQMAALLVCSLGILFVWGWYQWRTEHPLINLRLFANRRVLTAYACMALIAMGTMQIALIMSSFFQQPAWTGVGFALSATVAGMMLFPTNMVGLLGAPLSGRIAGQHGARRALIIGASLLIVGWGGMVLGHGQLVITGILITVAAFGFSMLYAAIPNLVIEAVPESLTSEATGISSVVRATFMAVGAQAMGLILSYSSLTTPETGARLPSAEGFQLGFVYIVVMSLLCLILALKLKPLKPALHTIADSSATATHHHTRSSTG